MRRRQPTSLLIIALISVCYGAPLAQAQISLLRDYRPPHLPPGSQGEFEDLDGDGDPDVLRGRTASGVPFQWIDDDDDMTPADRSGDTDSDCLMIDRNRDGQYGAFEDLIVDWNDEDGDGQADLQTIVDNAKPDSTTHGPGHYMIVVDCDHDGVFNYVDWRDFKLKCWEHAGLSHFFEDYLGTSLFLKIHTQTANLKDPRFSWENPFLFYDEDDDGVTEKAIRLCDSFKTLPAPRENFKLPADGHAITDAERRFEFTQRIDWVSIAQDLDNDARPGNEFDYDMTLHFHGPGFDYADQVHKYASLRGLPGSEKFFYDPRWRQIDALIYPDHEAVWDLIFQRGEWTRCWFVYDEDDDCQRWERVELYDPLDPFKIGVRQGGLDQNPQADSSGDRGEWDNDCSGKGQLYISGFDGRLHLFGAEWGAWRIDQDAHFFQGWSRSSNTAEKFATIKYTDTDGNGFLDRIEYDLDGDHDFERAASLIELGLDDRCETVEPRSMSYADFQALHKRVVAGLWRRAQAAIQVAEANQLDIQPYAQFLSPGSLREKYDFGYWINFYIYNDLHDLARHLNDQMFIKQLDLAYYSGDWSQLTKRLAARDHHPTQHHVINR